MSSGRRYTQKGDFWFDDDSGLWKPSDFTKARNWHIIVIQEFFKPNKSGVSDFVEIELIIDRFPELRAAIGQNGSNVFTRGLLAKNFVFSDDDAIIREGGRGNGKITHRRSIGLVDTSPISGNINPKIHKEISSRPCVLTGTRTRVEVDHKEGRKTDPERYSPGNQSIDDFQALCAVGNLIKREACARCKRTNQRFDARKIGYNVGWIKGAAAYRGTCEGCYWYDIVAFRRSLHKGKPS